MRQLILIIFFNYTFCLIAQNNFTNIYTYQYSYKVDKTKEKPQIENMLLLTNNKESYFVSTSNYLKDSLKVTNTYKAKNHVDQVDILRKYPTNNNYFILTNSSKKTIQYYEYIALNPPNTLSYIENHIIKWIIAKEKDKINGLDCIKATTQLYGRQWTAWYSTTIALPFGPYKFYGLPGIIVKIEDSSKSHLYILKKIEKVNQKFPLNKYDNLLQTTKKDAHKLIDKAKYTTAPFQGMKFDDPSIIKKIEKTLNDKKRNETNTIELQLEP